jgi:hypothetical protein
MVRSRFGYRTPVPSITTQKGQTQSLSFKDGVNSYKDNDDVKNTELVAAIDARMINIGRYKTRRGLDRFTTPIGEASNASVLSTTGASTFTLSATNAIAQRVTATSTNRVTRVDVRLRSSMASKGVLLVELYTNAAGMPGVLLGRSSIPASSVTSSFTYIPSYFLEAPLITNGTQYYVVVRAQNEQMGTYEISTTTSATTALQSITDGLVWTSTTFAANVNVYTSTNGTVKGLFKAYRPNGQVRTIFAFNDTMYEANANGTTAVIKSGMAAGATKYRFSMDQDIIRWTNGLEKPYKWDFTTVTQITDVPVIPNNIMSHKGLIFYTNDADPTAVNYSNFAEYDKFTSTDFLYMPGPKNADGLRAMAPLNGVLYFFSKRNKRLLLGSDNDTFQDDDAPSQRGTFSQESLVYDSNYIYHADDEGVWQFNGSEERNLAEDFLEDYRAIVNKESINLDVFNNRLYIWYTPVGAADNAECFVYNLALNLYESLDKKTIIGRTFGRATQDDTFIQASNRVGALYYGERSTNDYHNLGDQLQTALYTAYSHFDTPSQLKRIPKQRPQLPSVSGSYSVQAGYDKDFANNPVYRDVDVSGQGGRYNTGLRFNTGVKYAGQRIVTPKNLWIPGTFNRLQRIYQHVAAREPFEFDSEVMTVEVQRLD